MLCFQRKHGTGFLPFSRTTEFYRIGKVMLKKEFRVVVISHILAKSISGAKFSMAELKMPGYEKLKALVVNDTEEHAFIVGRKLDAAGFAVYRAGNFKEARKVARSQAPNVAVIDTNVGQEWGPNLAEELYEMNSRIYVVGISVNANSDVFWRGLEGVGDCDFQATGIFDAAKVLAGYKKRGGAARRMAAGN